MACVQMYIMCVCMACVQMYEFPDRLPPTPRLPYELTCYMGLVFQPYSTANATYPLLPKPGIATLRHEHHALAVTSKNCNIGILYIYIYI